MGMVKMVVGELGPVVCGGTRRFDSRYVLAGTIEEFDYIVRTRIIIRN